MKKILFLAIGCAFFTISCSNETENIGNLNDSHNKTELNTNSSIRQSTEYKDFDKLYMDFIHGRIDIKQFLYTTESFNTAVAFLLSIGEYSMGGYTTQEDIMTYALTKYLEITNS
ncbi:hypothetical protein [Myroides sp. TSA_177.3]|uniref:hypothetical protein n=1 Tax=Myroides sp. TSA_177.3 TaxID=3415650 RepID=UPI004046480A